MLDCEYRVTNLQTSFSAETSRPGKTSAFEGQRIMQFSNFIGQYSDFFQGGTISGLDLDS